MALRHKIPLFEVGPQVKDVVVTAQVFRPPVDVAFRKGANLASLAEQILDYQTVRVRAAVGAGKSTLLPKQLALEFKQLVLHVVPNAMLAVDLYNYVAKCANEDQAAYPPLARYSVGMTELPRTGVLFLSSAQYVHLALSGLLPVEGSYLVYLDEAHESDAYTFVVRSLSLQLGAANLVLASATFDPSDAIMRETLGTVERGVFSSDSLVTSWKVDEPGNPWSVTSIYNNLLVFVDSRSDSAYLKQAYSGFGLLVFRLEANMNEDDFVLAMRALRDKKGPMVVLLADSSFRSGFSFDVDVVIDTGRVSYYQYIPTGVQRVSREVYETEKVQAAGRAGRLRKGLVKYFSPDVRSPRVVCDLEAVEVEAAAYVYRMLGFKPVGFLGSAVMARDVLPDEFAFHKVINSLYPLPYYVRDGTNSPRSSTPVSNGSFARTGHVSANSVGSVSVRSDAMSSGVTTPDDSVVEEPQITLSQMYEQMLSVAPDLPFDFEDGMYVQALGLSEVAYSEVCGLFPRGLESVVRLLTSIDNLDQATVVSTLKFSERSYAAAAIVGRYNTLNLHVRAMDKVTTRIFEERLFEKFRQFGFPAVFAQFVEYRASLTAERGILAGLLLVVTNSFSTLASLQVLLETELLEAGLHYDGFVSKLRVGHTIGGEDSNFKLKGLSDATPITVSRSLRSDSSKEQSVISRRSTSVGMPAWTGLKSIEYKSTADDGVKAVKFRMNGFGRALTRRESVEVSEGCTKAKLLGGKVQKTWH